MLKNNYSFISRLLHSLILSSNKTLELLYDIENTIYKNKITDTKKHIFICGLARSGSTILMRLLYSSNQFASLTYKDMPFVISPNFWNIFANKKINSNLTQRPHGDSIYIDYHSPEAFEEVFWKMISKNNYIKNNLHLNKINKDEILKFKKYIDLITYKYNKKFYLSKNNNNFLRLKDLVTFFPNALILVPFRNPIDQSFSLLNQHNKFLKLQTNDKFILKYMNFLGHHEFGLGHKKFNLKKNDFKDNYDKITVEYWLQSWIETYEFVINNELYKKNNFKLINYDDLCKETSKYFHFFSEYINTNISYDNNLISRNLNKNTSTINNKSLRDKSLEVFQELNKYSI